MNRQIKQKRILKFIACALVSMSMYLSMCQQACAQVAADRVVVFMDLDSKPMETVNVSNRAESTIGVNVTLMKATAPGAKDEKLLPTRDLLAAPLNFSLKGNSERAVRLVLRTRDEDTEGVYRVSFVPKVAGDSDVGAELRAPNGKGPILRLLTGVGALVFVEPKKLRRSIRWGRESGSLHITNDGNVNWLVSNVSSCRAAESGCSKPTSFRLYPGESRRIAGSGGPHFSFHLKRSDKVWKVELAPGQKEGDFQSVEAQVED